MTAEAAQVKAPALSAAELEEFTAKLVAALKSGYDP